MEHLHTAYQDTLREVQRLTQEIQKQHRRIHHRTVLYKHSGVPTSPEKREMMNERLIELNIERDILDSAAQTLWRKIQAAKGFPDWQYSDLLLANLTLLVERAGESQLLREARKLTKAAIHAKDFQMH